jgi:TonB family protein
MFLPENAQPNAATFRLRSAVTSTSRRYQSPLTQGTFTVNSASRKVNISPVHSPGSGSRIGAQRKAVSNYLESALLPEAKLNWRAMASSYGLVIFLIVVLINIELIWPERLELAPTYILTEIVPLPRSQPKPLKMRTPRSLPARLLPAAFPASKLTVPRELRVLRPEAQPLEAPKVALNNFTPAVLRQIPGGARPSLVVHTGEFGSSATPTVNAPVQKVQTGGFGDPNGIHGPGKPNAHLVAANAGFFDLPPGAGYGNGTGGANGIKGTVASAGFGNGIAVGGQGDGRSNGRGSAGVEIGAFGAQQVTRAAYRAQQVESGPATSPVEIIFKPNPVYTEEARQLKLQGEVLLEVMFGANGQLHVNRVVRGMGHGLDEAAITAANQMRFKPAQHKGTPVDSTAVVHVVFQLAS